MFRRGLNGKAALQEFSLRVGTLAPLGSHAARTWREFNKLGKVVAKITRFLRVRARDFRAPCFDKRTRVNLPPTPCEGSKDGDDPPGKDR
ncbi:hypothetical protein C0Q70_09888 [Pomacea canaliculata]|uniref:Uncharacterized protein n=1 Tax=Pomacea canaliculata TaxID=400727 RepID=A0A2T7PB13_POMCA|nr:hypothetical protein C0Q70_09888 [Pomacea canaliculata]